MSPGGELTRAAVENGGDRHRNGNIGIEGVTNDPLNPRHMIAVKESGPERIYSTDIDWEAETATNFEAEAPAPANRPTLPDPRSRHPRLLRRLRAGQRPRHRAAARRIEPAGDQPGIGRVVNISRSGTSTAACAELADSDTVSVPDMTNEGVDDGPERHALHRRRGRRRHGGAPPALGLRTADDRRHGADRGDPRAARSPRCRNRPPARASSSPTVRSPTPTASAKTTSA